MSHNEPLLTIVITEIWIKNNCERFDIIIDGTKHDKMNLNFVEGQLHYYYRPKYEN